MGQKTSLCFFETTNDMKVVLYVRVSTRDQRLSRQLQELDEMCKSKTWKILSKQSDVVSGANPFRSRPGFKKVLQICKKERGATVVVHEISRLGRNTLDVLKCIEELNNFGAGVYIYNINILVSPDRTDPSANLIVSVLASLAAHERELMRERIKSGIKSSTKVSGRPKGSKYTLTKYRKKYPVYVRMIEDGYSLSEIDAIAQDISYSTLKRIKKLIILH